MMQLVSIFVVCHQNNYVAATEQKRFEEKREQERTARTQIEFTPANPVRAPETKKGRM